MEKKKCQMSVDGMHCDSCELYISSVLKKEAGVSDISAHSRSQTVSFTIDEIVDVDELRKKINSQISTSGYEMKPEGTHKHHHSWKSYVMPFVFALVLSIILYALQQLNVAKFFNAVELSYGAIFFLGVVASLTTCMAVVGGLALSLSSALAKEHKTKAIGIFHISRIMGFIILGGITAMLGKVIIVTGVVAQLLKLLVALSMVVIGLDLLDIRLPKIVLPKQLAQMFSVFEDKEGGMQAFLLGVSTYFLPCAFTQSMQLYALSSGSFWQGAMIMGVFVLGTAPVLFLVSGGSATVVSKLRSQSVLFTMGFLVLLFALFIVYEVVRLLLMTYGA